MADVDPDELHGLLYNTGKLPLSGVKFKVIIIHARFGDATLIEVTHDQSKYEALIYLFYFKCFLMHGKPALTNGLWTT